MDNQVQLSLSFQWRQMGDVLIDDGGKIAFPRLPRQPGVYKIAIREFNGTQSMYVGETDELPRRFAHYRNPGPTQRTNRRISAVLINTLTAGGTASIAVATEARLHDGDDVQALDLATKPARLLAENAALVRAAIDGELRIENLWF